MRVNSEICLDVVWFLTCESTEANTGDTPYIRERAEESGVSLDRYQAASSATQR